MSERAGTVVAGGEAEIGFQQISALLPIPSVDSPAHRDPSQRKSLCYRREFPRMPRDGRKLER
jgi:hypothetical protein